MKVAWNTPYDQLTIAEAAHILDVSISTLRNWDKKGKLVPHRHPINKYRLYSRNEIEELKRKIKGKL